MCCSENFETFMALLSSPGPGDYEKILVLDGPATGKQVRRHRTSVLSMSAEKTAQGAGLRYAESGT